MRASYLRGNLSFNGSRFTRQSTRVDARRVACRYHPERRRREGKEIRCGGATVISNAKTIPSSDRRRESLEISTPVFVAFARVREMCGRSNYLPVYCSGARRAVTISFSTRFATAPGDRLVVASNNGAASLAPPPVSITRWN